MFDEIPDLAVFCSDVQNRVAIDPASGNVVGWIDLASPECEEQLLEFAGHPKFVGVRHVTQDEPDDDFIVRPDVLRGLAVLEKHGMPFDMLFYVKHLKHAATLAKPMKSRNSATDRGA